MGTRARKTAASLLLGVGLASGCVWSCAALVGVEDVKLRGKDSGTGDNEDDLPPDDGPSKTDNVAPPPENVLTVALGRLHTCARKTDKTVKCWGDDAVGQLGTGTTADGGASMTAVNANVKGAIAISAGDRHTCVVLENNTMKCWGYNQDGQLGNGQSNTLSSTPVDVTGITDAIAVACGATFSCALRTNGRVAKPVNGKATGSGIIIDGRGKW